MEYEIEVLLIIEFLKDEIEGLDEYNQVFKNVKDEDIHSMMSEIINSKRQHVVMLSTWINEKVKQSIK